MQVALTSQETEKVTNFPPLVSMTAIQIRATIAIVLYVIFQLRVGGISRICKHREQLNILGEDKYILNSKGVVLKSI